MTFIKKSFLFVAAALLSKVSAHGIVQGIVVDGVWYSGYSPSFQYQSVPPVVAGWSIPEDSDTGFVSDYNSPDIVCHKGATPGGAYITVAAGADVTLLWTVWPESHKGPVMDYLANCNGDCTTVDKTELLFSKIDEAGLINGSPAPGTWASDTLIANNNSWTVTIPPTIAPGKYVLRHETIALHSAENLDGSQAYPQCVNLEITGSGTNTLTSGTVAQDFYKDTDPGIFVNIYYPALTNYTIPGPALIVDAVSESQPDGPGSITATAMPTSASSSGTATSKGAFPTTAPYMNTTSTTAIISDTKPSTHADAVTTKSTSSTTAAGNMFSSKFVSPASSSTTTWADWSYSTSSSTAAALAITSSSATGFPHPSPMKSAVNPVETSTSTPATFGISFTSTFTGRIGKPTKFTCYIDED